MEYRTKEWELCDITLTAHEKAVNAMHDKYHKTIEKVKQFLEDFLDSSEEAQSSSDALDTLNQFQQPARDLLVKILNKNT